MHISFYAAKEDNLEICHLLTTCLQNPIHVPFFSGRADNTPLPFTFADKHMIYYISEAALFDQILYHECSEGGYTYCLDFKKSPVLEFAPSYEMTDTYMEGRLACSSKNRIFNKKIAPIQEFIEHNFVQAGQSYISKKIKRQATILSHIR